MPWFSTSTVIRNRAIIYLEDGPANNRSIGTWEISMVDIYQSELNVDLLGIAVV